MKQSRIDEIEKEAKRRLKLWLKHSSFEDMSVGFSRIRFEMSLGLLDGYPFEKLDWMKNKRYNSFVTDTEFDSIEYDLIIDKIFNEQYHETTK